MLKEYSGTSTYAGKDAEPLTIEKIREALEAVGKMPRQAVFIFNPNVPGDAIYHGDIVDELTGKWFKGFNPKLNKAYLASTKHEAEINILRSEVILKDILEEF